MMSRRFTLSIAAPFVATLLSAPCPAVANQLAPGSFEFSPRVSFNHSNVKREGYGNVDRATEIDLRPTIGYCITSRYEVTGGMLIRHTSFNGNSDTGLGTTAGLIYNFAPRGGVIPFAGLGFGVLFNDGFTFDDTAVLFPDLSGGIRVLVGNAGSVNMGLGYQRESDGHVKVNRVLASVGVSLFPWSVR